MTQTGAIAPLTTQNLGSVPPEKKEPNSNQEFLDQKPTKSPVKSNSVIQNSKILEKFLGPSNHVEKQKC